MGKRMPEGWNPPWPGIDGDFGDDISEITIAYYGIQQKESLNINQNSFINWFTSLIDTDNGPKHVDRAQVTDNEGYQNSYFVAYWNNHKEYEKWIGSSSFQSYWNSDDRLNEDFGIWREVLRVPIKRMEILFSSPDSAGSAEMCTFNKDLVQEHAYWGGMRDRIPESATCPFHSTAGDNLSQPVLSDSLNKRIQVDPPENLAIIRSGQNLNDMKEKEQTYYDENIKPHLLTGMEYIGKNPLDTGCCINRFSDELDENWNPQKKTFGAAIFLSLEHMEKWAEFHPTHLQIFGAFMQMAKHFNFELDLKLWHEVTVLPKDKQLFEYINCHNRTGIMPWFKQTITA